MYEDSMVVVVVCVCVGVVLGREGETVGVCPDL